MSDIFSHLEGWSREDQLAVVENLISEESGDLNQYEADYQQLATQIEKMEREMEELTFKINKEKLHLQPYFKKRLELFGNFKPGDKVAIENNGEITTGIIVGESEFSEHWEWRRIAKSTQKPFKRVEVLRFDAGAFKVSDSQSQDYK